MAALREGQHTSRVTISDAAGIGQLGDIVAVWAHPDDEAYLCAAVMAAAVRTGSRVVVVTATKGELGVTDPVRWPPDQLAQIRAAELAACLAILGVTEHRWLDYPDGGCAEVDPERAVSALIEVLETVRPATVLTFPPDGQTGHPDHIAVYRWTAEAVRRSGIGTLHVVANTAEWLQERLPVFERLGAIVGDPPIAWTGPLSVDLRIEGELLDLKHAALTAQTSQTEPLRTALGDEEYRAIVAVERFGVLDPSIVTRE